MIRFNEEELTFLKNQATGRLVRFVTNEMKIVTISAETAIFHIPEITG